MKIFIHRNGRTYGPYHPDSVKRFIKEKRASLQDTASIEGIDGTAPLELFLENLDTAAKCHCVSTNRDREFILSKVKEDGWLLALASDEFKADREIVLAAVQEDGEALEHAAEELQQDEELRKIAEE